MLFFMLFLLPTFWNHSIFNLSGSCVLNWHLPLHKCLLMLHRTLCARLGCGSIVRSSWILNMQQLHSNFAHFQIHDDREAPRSFAILVSERRLWVLQCWTPSNLECFFQSFPEICRLLCFSQILLRSLFRYFRLHISFSSFIPTTFQREAAKHEADGSWLLAAEWCALFGWRTSRSSFHHSSNLQLHGFLIPSHSLA